MNFLLLWWKRSSPGPGTGNVDIPIGILMILGCASLQKSTFPHKTWNFIKFHNFQEMPWTSWISWFPQKILTLQWRTPQIHQYSLRNINVFAWAAREAPVSRKNWKFQEIPQNHGKSWKFRKMQKFCEKREKRQPRLGPQAGPRPGPAGGPLLL